MTLARQETLPALAMATNAQRTLRKTLRFTGIGLHTGIASTVLLQPAPAHAGVIFATGPHRISATVENVRGAALCTSLGGVHHGREFRVHNVAHLLAALAAERVDNARVLLTGPEVPVMDGSASPFTTALRGNVVDIPGVRRTRIVVRRPVSVTLKGGRGGSTAPTSVTLEPPLCGDVAGDAGLTLDVTVDYGARIKAGAGGRQRVEFAVTPEVFRNHIARARTFCFADEVEAMRAKGLVRGSSMDNAVVFKNGICINPDGLRYGDEAARHTVLDSIGDLSLGGNIAAHYVAQRPEHALNVMLLRILYLDPGNYEIIR